MSPLAGKNVRGLAVYENLIVSGGEDSSIRVFTTSTFKKAVKSIRIPLPGKTTVETPLHVSGKLSEVKKSSYNMIKCVVEW